MKRGDGDITIKNVDMVDICEIDYTKGGVPWTEKLINLTVDATIEAFNAKQNLSDVAKWIREKLDNSSEGYVSPRIEKACLKQYPNRKFWNVVAGRHYGSD
eukprot:1300742-Amorphochlora_amoeboformis.AAC.2